MAKKRSSQTKGTRKKKGTKGTRRKKKTTKKRAPAKALARKKMEKKAEKEVEEEFGKGVERKIEREVEPEASLRVTPSWGPTAEIEVEELTFGEPETEIKPLPEEVRREPAEEIPQEPLAEPLPIRKIKPKRKRVATFARMGVITSGWVLLFIAVLMIGFMVRGAIYQIEREKPERKEIAASPGLNEEIEAGNLAPVAKLEVIGEEVNFRSAPKISPGTLIGKLKKGTILFVLSQSKGWYLVATSAGEDGYVKGYITTDPAYTKKLEMEKK